MRNILFWQRWPTPERIIFTIAALLFILSIANLGYSYLVTPSPVIELQSIIESRLTEVPYESFRKGAFELTVPGNNYTVTERFLGTPFEPNLTANYVWLTVFTLCITGLLAIVTTLPRYYYLGSMGVFILLVVSLKLETLLMFGRDDKSSTIAVLLAYGLCSFHIYYFLPGLKLVPRILYFAGVTAFTGLMIFFFSDSPLPGLHLATYSFQAGMIACVLFIVTVAHEIIASFVAILTRNTRQGRTLNHFLLITLFYFLNLVAAYAIKFGYLKWDIFTIDLFVLLIISGILGVWGITQRQQQLDGIVDVEPHGVTGYMLLGALAFGAIALFLGTANDPAYDAVQDIIIFCHLGYGFIFVLYIISNFGGLLQNNMAVHKVLYNPTTMPFFTFRFAGLITSIAIIIYNAWQVPAHNAMGGYQNAVADLYLLNDNSRVAAIYYDQGRNYAYSNHRSNYSLANLAGLKFDHDGEKGFYKRASYLRPTEMSYLNWAQMWQTEENTGEAIIVLKEGLTHFPKSTAIANSLGLLYAEAGKADTAAMYLNHLSSAYASSNLLALAARKQLPLLADTSYQADDQAGLMTNKVAFAISLGKKSQVPLKLTGDTALSTSQAAYINNCIVNLPAKADTSTLASIEALARKDANSGVAEPLLFATALGLYSSGEIQRAFKLLEEVAIGSSTKGKYNNILGLWSLEQNEPQRGQGYIEYALSQEYPAAVITNAVSLTESLRYAPLDNTAPINRALVAWDSVRKIPDSTLSKLAVRMTRLLTATASSIETMSDEDKYAFARYRIRPWDIAATNRALAGISDPNLKSRAFLETSQLHLDYDNVPGASAAFDNVREVRVTDTGLYDDLRLHERLLLAARGDIEGLRRAGESPLKLEGRKAIHALYFEALFANAAGDTVSASKHFEVIARRSLFFDQGIVEAAKHFASHGIDALRAYNLLVDAVQHRPSSVRLRKAYIMEATRMGFEDFADHALSELKALIPANDYQKFASEVRANQLDSSNLQP